jgi:hypothetical protein
LVADAHLLPVGVEVGEVDVEGLKEFELGRAVAVEDGVMDKETAKDNDFFGDSDATGEGEKRPV